jgi:hypothetical protein
MRLESQDFQPFHTPIEVLRSAVASFEDLSGLLQDLLCERPARVVPGVGVDDRGGSRAEHVSDKCVDVDVADRIGLAYGVSKTTAL